MRLLTVILLTLLDILPVGQSFLVPLQQRDSILIADQLEYGFQLDSVDSETQLALPDFSKVCNDTLALVRNWELDTLKFRKKSALMNIRAKVVLAPFEEGTYHLPDIPVLRSQGGCTDTLLFSGLEMEVKTMPVDTATFEMHDIKGQIRYPLTFREVFPWALGVLVLAALVVLAVWLIRRRIAARKGLDGAQRDPAYIVALRELDKYRGNKYWAPEKQKQFYSGITDALKFYMGDRYGLDAPEMTTAELFDALKVVPGIPKDLFDEAKELFEVADFVKFAKHTVSDDENAKALPLAIRFVTDTHQAEVEKEVEDVL